MERLFNVMTDCIDALSPDIAQKVQKRIQQCRNLELDLQSTMNHRERSVIRPWAKSRKHLLSRTIYGFALQLDMALLEGTNLEYKKEDYAVYGLMPSGQPGPKSLNRPHFTAALRALCGPSSRYVEEVKGMLNIMNEEIARNRAQLRAELLSKRGSPSEGEGTSPSVRGPGSARAAGSARGTGSNSATSLEGGGIISEEEFRTWRSWSRNESSSPGSDSQTGSQSQYRSSQYLSSLTNSSLQMHGALQGQFGSPRRNGQYNLPLGAELE